MEKVTADGRIKTLIENNVKLGHRALLTILGENARDQVMIIHHLVSKASGERPSVLWCHKKDSDVPRQSRKQLKKLEQRLKSGKCDISQENAFHIFLLSTSVRYCSLTDTQRVLGNTYGMCVIQDFEGLTNTLCRVVETVSGGGVVVFLLPGMQSLRQLFSLNMDSHGRLKTYSHPKVTPLFNERFVLSLGWCRSSLIVDDKLQLMSELPSLAGPVKLWQSLSYKRWSLCKNNCRTCRRALRMQTNHFRSFDALGYEEQSDYEIIQSTNEEFNEAIVRVNVFREFRQTIQYVDPVDANKLGQCELLVIDEAAAIPLPQVKALIGNYSVFMASTINGYEGTGRSLSLKLLQQLRQQSSSAGATAVKSVDISSEIISNRSLHELYYVNRDVLFSGHKESEDFLHQVMSLLVSSHYRNSPDDLQVLCDAPAHHLFVLLPPIISGMTSLPPVLAVVQVCLEGGIPKSVSDGNKSRGERPSGDLVPWALALQYLDTSLTEQVSARVIRVAAHPDYQGMGYGSRAINLVSDYYNGKHISLEDEQDSGVGTDEEDKDSNAIVPRKSGKPLLSKLSERVPESLDYLSVSYGLTLPLMKFWCRAGYIPLYISQVANKVTGEHSCMMIKLMDASEGESPLARNKWVKNASQEFLRRFISLLGGPFSNLPSLLALKVIQSHSTTQEKEIKWKELKSMVSGHDLHRLEKYSNNLADRYLVTDLLPNIATLFFLNKFPSVHLSPVQSGLLVGLGLQMKTMDNVVSTLDITLESALGQFNRAIRRLLKAMTSIQESSLAQHLPAPVVPEFVPVDITLDQDLNQAAEDFERDQKKKEKLQEINSLIMGDVRKYRIQGDDRAWESVLEGGAGASVTIKSSKRTAKMTEKELENMLEAPTKKKKTKDGQGGKQVKDKKNKKLGKKR
ncbi:putative N-acetyltransferase 10 isoform X1 [Penaeus vannamei]|uniref:RNA cytidine acetyltransferase n=1 Tax=Penaeus vannamei TaxID=6689 RepID=A0A423TE35_PENVA|nr:putative N-acetyltransferase 10 isoform X1 [Penaeus vannamei]